MATSEAILNKHVVCGIILTFNALLSSCSQFPGKDEYTLNLTTTACLGNDRSSSSPSSSSSSFSCSSLSSITINGEEKSLQQNGFNLAVINPDTRIVKTFHINSTSSTLKEEFQKFFAEVEEKSIIVIVLQNMRENFDRFWYKSLPNKVVSEEPYSHNDYTNAILVQCKGWCPTTSIPYTHFGYGRTANGVVQFTLGGARRGSSDSLGLICGGIIAFLFIICIGLILYVSHKSTIMAFGGSLRRHAGVGKECVVDFGEKDSDEICDEKTALNTCTEKTSCEHLDIIPATVLDVPYKPTTPNSDVPNILPIMTSNVSYELPMTISNASYTCPRPDSTILQVPKELYVDEPCKSPRPNSGAYKHVPIVPHAEKCFKSPRPNSETYQQLPADIHADKSFKTRSMSKSKTFCQGVYGGKGYRSPRSDSKTFARHGSSRSHSDKHYKTPRSEGRTYSEVSVADSAASETTTISDGSGKVPSLKVMTG